MEYTASKICVWSSEAAKASVNKTLYKL